MRAGGLGGFKSFIDGQEPQDESQTALLINKKTKLDLKSTGPSDAEPVHFTDHATSKSQVFQKSSEQRKIPEYIMLPDGQARTVWMYLQLAVAMYIIWVTPIRVGFNLPAEGCWFWMEGMIDLFFYVDLVLNFFVAYEDPVTGDIIADQKKIAMRYLQGWFAIDLLSTFPTDYIVRAVEGTWMCSLRGNCLWSATATVGGVSMIRMLRVVRIFRIFWILKHLKFMRFTTLLGGFADDLYTIMPVFSILELLVVLLYLGHFSGCFFYLLSTPPYQTAGEKRLIEEGEIETWVTKSFGGDRLIMVPSLYHGNATQAVASATLGRDPMSKLWYQCPEFGYDFKACLGCDGPKARCVSHYSLFFRYITSMYWAYTTMTTVGYGDISSFTYAEKVWAILTMIGSGFFFSFVVGRMASVISKLDSVRNAHSEKLETLTTFLKDVNLPRPLSKRVLDFFKKQQVKPYDRQQVLAILPFELRSKILRHLYGGTIARVPLLQRMAHDDVFLTDISVRLQHYTSTRDSFIYQRGEVGGDVFILVRGELHVLDLDQETFLFRIPEGSMFGEATVLRHMEGFARAKRTDNVWCATPCTLLRIAQEDMSDLMERYPELLETLKKLNRARNHKYQMVKSTIKAVHRSEQVVDMQGSASGDLIGAKRTLSRVSSGRQAASSGRQIKLEALKDLPMLPDVDDAETPRLTDPNRPKEEASPHHSRRDELPGSWADEQQQLRVHSLEAASSLQHRSRSLPNLARIRQGTADSLGSEGAASSDDGDKGSCALDSASVAARADAGLERGASSEVGLPTTSTGPAARAGVAGTGGQAVAASELQLLRQQVAEQYQTVAEELNVQRYMIHQVPGRIMNHLVMVLGAPTAQQQQMLTQATEQWNVRNNWNA